MPRLRKDRPAVNTSAAWLASEISARAIPACAARTPKAVLRSGRPHSPAPDRRRLQGDRGEGVISAAIAVLIMAFLGAAMWFGFQTMMSKTECKVTNQVEQIGNEGKAAAPAGC
jgi:uncharacterized protein HemX